LDYFVTFDISIIPLRNNIEMLSLSMPYTYETIITELEKEDWGQNKSQPEHTSNVTNPLVKRHILIDPTSGILKEVKTFITSAAIKEKIVDSLYNDFPNMQYLWNGWSKKQMIERTVWDGCFIMDEPGFSMSKHLDTRTNVATGIVYLNNEADDRRTTIFYTDKAGNNELKIDNTFGQGVLSINDADTWHEVQNNTSKPRYVMVLVLLLLIDFYDSEKHSSLFSPPPKLTL
jgi:hypothetical protein